ncbi:hypothetical protein BCV70DRAFT_198662 [Testicularia cyperi]|uniref:Uncharacterized protein n=1 Tax=Testicularia cyperi TaxID=1882483 RepID=A0A317XX28_9BASI|nr:hypothetical protein BCV70DRAFT_198662 [Testicularia cyperi]
MCRRVSSSVASGEKCRYVAKSVKLVDMCRAVSSSVASVEGVASGEKWRKSVEQCRYKKSRATTVLETTRRQRSREQRLQLAAFVLLGWGVAARLPVPPPPIKIQAKPRMKRKREKERYAEYTYCDIWRLLCVCVFLFRGRIYGLFFIRSTTPPPTTHDPRIVDSLVGHGHGHAHRSYSQPC